MRVFTILCSVPLLLALIGVLNAEDQPAAKRELAVTLLEKPIYLDQITPSEAATKEKELSKPDYERWLRACRANFLLMNVSGRVMKDYTVREKLSPSDEEIIALVKKASERSPDYEATDKEAQRRLAIQRVWLWGASCDWRTAKALHAKYGGRVGISSFGACTAFEGRNAVLKEYAKRGDLKFHDADLERAFWEKTRDEKFSDVILQPDRVAQHFAIPPWERWPDPPVKPDSEKTKGEPKPSPQ